MTPDTPLPTEGTIPDDPVMSAYRERERKRLGAEKMPDPTEEEIAYGAHVLSEWLDDAAPLHEQRYRNPAKALLKFAAFWATDRTIRPAADAGLREAIRRERAELEVVIRRGRRPTYEPNHAEEFAAEVLDRVLSAAPAVRPAGGEVELRPR